MNVLIFGATGMVGQGVLQSCLADTSVRQVTTVGRSALPQTHAKLRDVVVPDVAKLEKVHPELTNFDACFFCLGVSAAGLSEDRYTELTYDLTLDVANYLVVRNPRMTFVYVSGLGTDSTEKGSTMWARVKGRTENAIMALPFKASYMFRPGFIQPENGIKSKTPLYRAVYAVSGPLFPLLKRVFPAYVTTTSEIGTAMIDVAQNGYSKRIVESVNISKIALDAKRM